MSPDEIIDNLADAVESINNVFMDEEDQEGGSPFTAKELSSLSDMMSDLNIMIKKMRELQ